MCPSCGIIYVRTTYVSTNHRCPDAHDASFTQESCSGLEHVNVCSNMCVCGDMSIPFLAQPVIPCLTVDYVTMGTLNVFDSSK